MQVVRVVCLLLLLVMLAVKGINFGVDLPLQYAGRKYKISDGKKEISYRFNPEDVPFNESSIDWWDYAQFSTCFSTQTNTMPVAPRFEVLDRTGYADGRLTFEVLVPGIDGLPLRLCTFSRQALSFSYFSRLASNM